MFRRTRFLSRDEAEREAGHADGVLISLIDPGSPPPRLGAHWRDVLRLAFFDADDSIAAEVEREGLRVCRPEDARRILAFIEGWHAAPGGPSELVTHCEQGISRSAAVARFAALRFGLDYRWAHPYYNDRVLRLLEEAAADGGAGGD